MSVTEMVSVLTDFDLQTGLSKTKKPLQHCLSQMKGMYADDDACNELLSQGDPLVTFYAFPGHAGHDYGSIETQ